MSAFDMKGTIDIHVHAGPSVAKRKVDSGEMLLNAQAAGYRAFVTKDHYFPSMMGTDMVTSIWETAPRRRWGASV